MPVDYQLKNLILYFWKQGYITYGWDQGHEDANMVVPGFISFSEKDINNNNSVVRLEKLFRKKLGKNAVEIYDQSNIRWLTKEDAIKGSKERNERLDTFFKDNPKKILIEISINHVAIQFKNSMLTLIHKKLKIEMPSKEDSYSGSGRLIILRIVKQ